MSFSLNSKIYIAGRNGMVGSALYRKLKALGYCNLILKFFKDLDLRNQKKTQDFFKKEQPEFGFKLGIEWDTSLPDGTAQKFFDVTKINNLGWKADIKLKDGIALSYNWYNKI